MTKATPFALLRIVVLISMAFRCSVGDAVGLGPMRLQSALGQPLRASVQVLGSDAKTLTETCVRSRLTSSDGSEIARPIIELRRPASGATEIFFTSPNSIEEPAVTLLVEITCAPTLNRDYQLLLDLKDGLPRVLSSDSESAVSSRRERAAPGKANLASAGGDGSASSLGEEAPAKPRRKRRPRVQPAVANLAPGQGTPDNLQVLEEPTPQSSRPKGLPGARNVLKLSQEDVSFGAPKGPTGLKLSDNLSIPGQPGLRSSDEIAVAKARFSAMMRGEDPVVAAQNEVRQLQNRLQLAEAQRAAPPEAAPPVPPPVEAAKPSSKPAAATTYSSAPMSGRWFIGLAMLLLASIIGVSLFRRMAKRTAETKSTPWWMTNNDNSTGREEELLQAARSSIEKKAAATPRTADEAAYHQDQAVENYVERFTSGYKPNSSPSDRVEPRGFEPAPADMMNAPQVATPVAIATANTMQLDSTPDTEMMSPSRASLATFELVSDVMQEAEFWKMLNETQRAIDILENYCNTESAASPVPWLYLADLYRENGDTDHLEQLRQQFQLAFNGRFDPTGDDTPLRESLEQYPHVIGRVTELWGHEDVLGYLQSLLLNDRDAPREGFHLPVYREILLLIEVALEREKTVA